MKVAKGVTLKYAEPDKRPKYVVQDCPVCGHKTNHEVVNLQHGGQRAGCVVCRTSNNLTAEVI
jgi:formate dehydrogenase maturation protein FdhE